MPPPDDEDPCVDVDRRHGCPAAVEDDDVRLSLGSERRALQHVRRRHRAREPTSRPATADRDDAGERSDLQVVRGSVLPSA